MISLEVAITAGSNDGQRVRVNQSPAAFGRDPSNPLVIDLPVVSRVHGEFRFENDRWVLANHSPNGTRLARKAVTTKPRAIKDGDQVVIGDTAVMQLALRDSPEFHGEESFGAHDSAPTPKRSSLSPRAKLWLGIVGFWTIVFAIAFIFLGLDEPSDSTSRRLPSLTADQIDREIRSTPDKQAPSQTNAIRYLEEAERYYQSLNVDPSNVFRAYYAYRQALSFSSSDYFTDGKDDWGGLPAAELALAQKHYLDMQDRLVPEVQDRYKTARDLLKAKRYRDAQRQFKDLMDYFEDSQSEIFKNTVKQRDVARRLSSR